MLLLFDDIRKRLIANPCISLGDLSAELKVGRRTIQKSVSLGASTTFRRFRQDLLLESVGRALQARPGLAIKEVAFSSGFKSAQSFTRAIKRASGLSPAQLRSRFAKNLPTDSRGGNSGDLDSGI
jgi:AraC-like DNA-binding protein